MSETTLSAEVWDAWVDFRKAREEAEEAYGRARVLYRDAMEAADAVYLDRVLKAISKEADE